MDFELSEDHLMMRDWAREFADKRLADIAEEMDADEAIPDDLIAEMGELGYFGLLAPENHKSFDFNEFSDMLFVKSR